MFDKLKKGVKKEKEISDEELINLQRSNINKRAKRCLERVNEVLNSENCEIDVSMELTSRGIIPKMNILPKPPTNKRK